jgi:hypothetical protein
VVSCGFGELSFTRRATEWVGNRPTDTAVFDATGDGISDIVVVNRNGDTVDLLQGDGWIDEQVLRTPEWVGPVRVSQITLVGRI